MLKSPERLFAEQHADLIISELHEPFVQIRIDEGLRMHMAHIALRVVLLSMGYDVKISEIDDEFIIRERKLCYEWR